LEPRSMAIPAAATASKRAQARNERNARSDRGPVFGRAPERTTSDGAVVTAEHSASPLAFQLASGFYGILGPGLGIQARLRNRLARHLAHPVRLVINAVQRAVDLAQLAAFGLSEPEHEVLIIHVSPDVG